MHSKAQKRVPVPDGLDMNEAFNPSALSKLLALKMPENLTLATLAFSNVIPVALMGNQMDGDDDRMLRSQSAPYPFPFPSDDLSKGAYPLISNDSHANTATKVIMPSFDNNFAATNHTGRSAEDNLFYLAPASRVVDVQTLSQSLAEAFETKKEKKAKGSKKEKRKKTDFNMKDMLPVGAISSDDEKGYSKKEKRSGSKKKSEVKHCSFVEAHCYTSSLLKFLKCSQCDQPSTFHTIYIQDLDSVDITTPLRPDEVFTVQKHREVLASTSSAVASDLMERDDGGKMKKNGKKSKESDDSKKSKHDKSSKSKKTKEPVDDLLLMEWAEPTVPTLSMGYVVPPSAPDKKDKDKESKNKLSSKKSGNIWIPLMTDKCVEIFYFTSVTGQIVTVNLKAMNIARNSSAVSVTTTFSSSATIRPTTPSNSNVRVAHQLAPGADSTAATELLLLGELCATSSLSIDCTAHVTSESLLGPEVKSTATVVRVPVCSFFTPNKIDEQGFQTLMAKTSSRWGSSSVMISCSSGKPKSALKAVGSFLRAHTVESEDSRAASLSAKSAGGGTVCCLAKISKDGLSVTVDIKCLCSSKGESKILADAISEVLSSLTL